MSVNTITATMQGSVRSSEDNLRGVDLAKHFEIMRKSVELTARAKLSAWLLLIGVAAMLAYGYLGPTSSDLISPIAFVLLAVATYPFFRGDAPGAADHRQM